MRTSDPKRKFVPLPPTSSDSKITEQESVPTAVDAQRLAVKFNIDTRSTDSGSKSWSEIGGWSVSLLMHAVLLLLMGLILLKPPLQQDVLSLLIENSSKSPDAEKLVTIIKPDVAIEAIKTETPIAIFNHFDQDQGLLNDPQLINPSRNTESLKTIPKINLNSHFGGRQPESRVELLKIFGGTAESERAVQKGLRWLSQRQREDGSWSFNHRRPGDQHGDHQAGTLSNCPIGATSLALMAFLGAGETQLTGKYQSEVSKGLEFLLRAGTTLREGVDFRGRVNLEVPPGNAPMYAHGLATIALCECYAMTADRRLRQSAEGAIDYLIQIRNRETGGWRYQPEQPGDLSVTGWMVMALQSGKSARIRISPAAWESTDQFLNACQQDRGARYAYIPGAGAKPSTTSIGLLCRMYQGWNRQDPALVSGIQYLNQLGPDPVNIYYNYYATQVMHHAGGNVWTMWNEKMREQLVKTQRSSGAEAGSWDVTDPHGSQGGRLYQTCMSIMTLEVYYRHLPLYQMNHLD